MIVIRGCACGGLRGGLHRSFHKLITDLRASGSLRSRLRAVAGLIVPVRDGHEPRSLRRHHPQLNVYVSVRCIIRLTVGVIVGAVFPVSVRGCLAPPPMAALPAIILPVPSGPGLPAPVGIRGPLPLELAGSSARRLCLACTFFQYRAKGALFASSPGILLLVPSALNLGLWRLSLRSPSGGGGGCSALGSGIAPAACTR